MDLSHHSRHMCVPKPTCDGLCSAACHVSHTERAYMPLMLPGASLAQPSSSRTRRRWTLQASPLETVLALALVQAQEPGRALARVAASMAMPPPLVPAVR